MKKFAVCLLILAGLFTSTTVAESIHEYVESLGFTFISTESDGGETPHCMLFEDSDYQSLVFNEDGTAYTLMALSVYQSSFDPNDFYHLFYDLNERYDWDVSFFWPNYNLTSEDTKIAISYGIVQDIDKTDGNYYDKEEYLNALSERFGFEEPQKTYNSPDFSGMSFDELIALRIEIDKAIWASDGWQEVDVPTGVYVVGEDIPAGRWSVIIADESREYVYCTFSVYESSEDYFKSYSYLSKDFLDVGKPHNINLIDGQLVEISGESVIFKPYTGAALGFK